MSDTFRERDLLSLGVQASVEVDRGICTIRMPADAFDRMVEKFTTHVPAPDWIEEVKDRIEEAEDALRDVSYQMRQVERREAEAKKGAA